MTSQQNVNPHLLCLSFHDAFWSPNRDNYYYDYFLCCGLYTEVSAVISPNKGQVFMTHCPSSQINSVTVHWGCWWSLSLSPADFERICPRRATEEHRKLKTEQHIVVCFFNEDESDVMSQLATTNKASVLSQQGSLRQAFQKEFLLLQGSSKLAKLQPVLFFTVWYLKQIVLETCNPQLPDFIRNKMLIYDPFRLRNSSFISTSLRCDDKDQLYFAESSVLLACGSLRVNITLCAKCRCAREECEIYCLSALKYY